MTALKALCLGILCLVLLALLAAGLGLGALVLGLDLHALLLPAGCVAALVICFFGLRRLWLFFARRRLTRQLMGPGPRAADTVSAEVSADSGMDALCAAGLSHLEKHALQQKPLVLFFGSPKSCVHALAKAMAPADEPLSDPGPLSWHFCEAVTALVPDPALLPLQDSRTRTDFEHTLALLAARSSTEPVTAMVAVVHAGELAALSPGKGSAGTFARQGGISSALAARNLAAEAQVLRSRMEDMLRVHKARMPLHVIITGLEDVPGFADLLPGLSPLSRQSLPGAEFAPLAELSAEACARQALAACATQVEAILLQEACLGSQPRGSALSAPRALADLEEGLALFLRALLFPHVEGRTPFLRSIRCVSLTVPLNASLATSLAAGNASSAGQPQADALAGTFPGSLIQMADTHPDQPQPVRPAPVAAASSLLATGLSLSAPAPAAAPGTGPAEAPQPAAGHRIISGTFTGSLAGPGAGTGAAPAAVSGLPGTLSAAPAAAATGGDGAGAATTCLPSFVQGLPSAIAHDRSLYVSLEEGSSKDRPRALAYAAGCLVLLGICGMVASAALHTTRSLHEAARIWTSAGTSAPGSQTGLLAQARAVRFLQAAREASFLPSLGLSTLDDELARSGRIFQENFRPLADTVFAECTSLALGSEQDNYAAMQRLLWLGNAVTMRREGKEPTLAFPLEPGNDRPTVWTPDFGTLFLTSLNLSSDAELAGLHQRLTTLSASLAGRDAEAIFNRLCQQETAAAPRNEFPMSRYWPSAPRGSAGFFSVPVIYTPEGYAAIRDSMASLSAEAGFAFRDQPFWKQYLQRYADVWAQFASRTDNAWLVTDNVESLQRMSEQGQGKNDPYLRLIHDMTDQLAPLFAENAFPAWADDLRLVRTLLLVCEARGSSDARSLASVLFDAIRLDGRDLSLITEEIRERQGAGFLAEAVNAFEAYLACLAELRATLMDADGSLALAAIDFGGKEYGDPDKTALARARAALQELARALDDDGSMQPRNGHTNPVVLLLGGPLRFLEQAITCSAAASLQRLWESEVLPEAALLPPEEAVEGLFGEKGLVTTFVTRHTAPFLTRSVGAFRAKTRNKVTFPFADAFLNVMQEGRTAHANPLREAYQTVLHTSAADVNPDAAQQLEYYELSLSCRKGRQLVRNANYPNDATFAWEPAGCTEARLGFSFPSLKLEYTYSDFKAFLEDFSFGERVFTAHDFPGMEARMAAQRISSIRVRILTDDSSQILSAFSGELVLPQRIVSTW